MKDDSMTPETVKTPPPLTPKDSLSVEVEDLKQAFDLWRTNISIPTHTREGILRLFEIVEELRKDREAEATAMEQFYPRQKALYDQLATTQVQLRRKDEALEKLAKLGNGDQYGNSIGNEIARAALADGKEGQQKKELENCQWCKKLVSHLIQITDKPDMHDARICEDCYTTGFAVEDDGKEGGK